jgi:mannosyl-3-phosphoglycerate phosphatase
MSDPAPPAIVFTDLDGTLLDASTYDPGPARATLSTLAGRGIPVVPVTSKTWEETRAWMQRLALSGPAVLENGGVVMLPSGPRRRPTFEVLGTDYVALRDALAALAPATASRLVGFGDWDAAEIAERTGLAPEEAARARVRLADEPFVADPELDPHAERQLAAAAAARGLLVERGGRFLHLHGRADKGTGVRRVTAWYALRAGAPPTRVGVGDAGNDRPMLEEVEVPIALPGLDGTVDRALAAVPGVRIAAEPGPRGFATAIAAWLESA